MPLTVVVPRKHKRQDLFFAATKVQSENYRPDPASENEQNTNNVRLFETPKTVILSSGEIEVTTSAHSDENVTAFNKLVNKADDADDAKDDEWTAILLQYPFQWDNNKEFDKKALISSPARHTKEQLARYCTEVVVLFQKIWPQIESDLRLKEGVYITKDLIFSLFVFLKTMLIPKGPEFQTQELMTINNLLTTIYNRISNQHYMNPKPDCSIESCCNSMMRLISLSLTQPIGQEAPYGGIFGTSENYWVKDLLDTQYNQEPYKAFTLPDYYKIPDACFLVSENTSDNQLLWNLFSQNTAFTDQIKMENCPPELYLATLHRLWDAFASDVRCPLSEEKCKILKAKITCTPLSIFFDRIANRIANCNRKNTISLENELLSLTQEALLTLSRQAKQHFLDIDNKNPSNSEIFSYIRASLSELTEKYTNDKKLNSRICSDILNKITYFLLSTGQAINNSSSNFYKVFEENIQTVFSFENRSREIYVQFGLENTDGTIDNFSASLFKTACVRCHSMNGMQIKETMKSLSSLKGSVPDELLISTLNTLRNEFNSKYENMIEFYKNTDLSTLLTLYAEQKQAQFDIDSSAIASCIEQCCSKKNLKSLSVTITNCFPTKSFMGFSSTPVLPKEISNIVKLLNSDKPIADILLAVQKATETMSYQTFAVSEAYKKIMTFIASNARLTSSDPPALQ